MPQTTWSKFVFITLLLIVGVFFSQFHVQAGDVGGPPPSPPTTSPPSVPSGSGMPAGAQPVSTDFTTAAVGPFNLSATCPGDRIVSGWNTGQAVAVGSFTIECAHLTYPAGTIGVRSFVASVPYLISGTQAVTQCPNNSFIGGVTVSNNIPTVIQCYRVTISGQQVQTLNPQEYNTQFGGQRFMSLSGIGYQNTGGNVSKLLIGTPYIIVPQAPTVTFSASPNQINAGGQSQLSWTTAPAGTITSISINQGIGAVSIPSGSFQVQPTQTTTYTLTVTNNTGQTTQAQATVTVLTPPTLTLTASPNPVTAGQPTQLTWTSTNATTVSASTIPGVTAGSSQVNSPAGGLSVTPNGIQTFSLTVQGPGGSISASVTVVAELNIGVQVQGDVFAKQQIGNITLVGPSILAAGNTVNVGGAALSLPGYVQSLALDFVQVAKTITTTVGRLEKERGRTLAPQTVTGTFNLNPPPTVNPFSGTLSRDILNPEGSIWVHTGDVTITDAVMHNRGTILVKNGTVTIDGNITYASGTARDHSFGLIVQNGNIILTANAKNVVGAYFATGTITVQ